MAEQNNTKYTNTLAAHLFMSNAAKNYEPQRTNNFELYVVGLDKNQNGGTMTNADGSKTCEELYAMSATGDGIARSDYAGKVRDLTLSVKAAFTPKENVSTLEVPYGNTKVKYAGIPSYDDGTITYNDYYDQDMELILKIWQAAAYDAHTGAVGDASNYKKTAYLTMFSPSGRIARRWKLIGCWVSTVNGDDMSNDGNNVRALSATFVYDAAIRLYKFDSEMSSNVANVGGSIETYTE